MANGDPIELPNLRDPRDLLVSGRRGAPKAQRNQSAGGILDGLASAWEDFEDPAMREIAKTMFEVQVSKSMGLPGKITLPDSQDLEMLNLQREADIRRLNKEILTDTVETAKAAVLDLGDDDPDIRKLGLVGVDRDTLMESNPTKFIELMNRKNMNIKRSDLSLYLKAKDTDTASAGPAFQQKQAEEQAKMVSTQAGFISDVEKIAKAEPAAAEGAKNALKASIEAMSTGENARNIDTDFFDSSLDTDDAGIAFADMIQTYVDGAGPVYKGMAARGVTEAFKDDVQGALEDEPATTDGKLIVGVGGADVDPGATLYLAAGVAKVANARGISLADAFKEFGLPFTGIDTESFNAFASQQIKKLGPEGSKPLIGLLESLQL